MAAEQRHSGENKKRSIPIWFFVLVLFLLGFAIFGDRGVLHVYKTYLQKTELEEKIGELEKTNAELRQEIDALRNDLKVIENIARRELGMVRPDELIYQFHSEEQQQLPDFPSEEHSDSGQVDTPPDDR